MSYTIDRDARLIRMSGNGLLTDDEMLQCVTALRADPALEPDLQTLSDMRDIEVGFTAAGVMRMVEVLRKTDTRREAVKVAIVTSSDAAFGMGRVFEGWSDTQVESQFRVFRDMDEANQWLASGND
ncbi:MAG: STAS/SEC14 domain-containing protein [Pseudomonadales bacterium]